MINNNQSSNQVSKYWIMDICGIAIIFALFYALWIGSYPLFTPDEGRYSEVAREMVVTHDYITPRLNGVAFLDKPALYYWFQAVAIHWFGLKEWALRFWPACMGILDALIVYMAGRILFSRRAGILSAIILATSPLFYGAAHYANLDLEVAALVSNALLCFIAAMQLSSSRMKKILFYSAYAFAGLAALTKGLIGIAFPTMIIGAWILILNRWHLLKKMQLFSGLLLFALITVPWYVLVQKANPEFLHFFFVTQQVSRFLTTQDFNSKAAVWFYVPVVLAGFFPWSIFLIQALVQKIRWIWQDRQRYSSELFLVLWFFIIFIFFSIPRSKTVGYILPLFPVMALLVGSYFNSAWNNSKETGMRIGSLLFIGVSFLIGIIFFGVPYFNHLFGFPVGFFPYLRGMAFTFILASIVTSYFMNHQTLRYFICCVTATIVILLGWFIAGAASLNENSVKPLAMKLKTSLQPADEVATYFKYYQDLPIYLQRKVTIAADWHAPDIPNKDNWLREMWYGMVFQDTKDWLIEKEAFLQRWKSKHRMYVLTSEGYYNDLKNQIKIYQVDKNNDVYLLTNHPL